MSESLYGLTSDLPLESRVLGHELVEVRHELVNRLPHVHMSNFSPDSIRIAQGSSLIFVSADGGLKFVSM